MLDLILDTAHEDQVSESLRYVRITEHIKVETMEVFPGFFQMSKKDAGSLAKTILEQLKEDNQRLSWPNIF